ncbi:hypothetical protein D3C76_1259120 [compost metagenome]
MRPGLHAFRQGRAALAVGPLGDQVGHFPEHYHPSDVPPAQRPVGTLGVSPTLALFGGQMASSVVQPTQCPGIEPFDIKGVQPFIRFELILGQGNA